MKKHSNYMTRALQSQDRRFARILGKLGYPTPAAVLETRAAEAEDALKALRDEYQEVVGKRAYHGWDADELREKIAAAKAQD